MVTSEYVLEKHCKFAILSDMPQRLVEFWSGNKKGRNCNSEEEGTDGARFIDDCFNIRRRLENFILG